MPSSLPPIERIQQALRNVTERLAFQVGRPQMARPQWTELEWRVAPAVAAMHGVSSLLASAARCDGPRRWVEFLERQREMAHARHRRLMSLLERIGEEALRNSIAILPLKGAALYRLGVYAAGERPMADLDLLIGRHDLEATARILTSVGYRESGANWKHLCFESACSDARTVLGEHADNPLKIDLHLKIAERLPLAEFEYTDLVAPREPCAGLNDYRSPAGLMLHVLLHAAGSMVHRGVRLLQLVDIARLAERMTRGDWNALVSGHRPESRMSCIAAPLILAQRYLPVAAPPDVLERLTTACPALLRRVARRRTLSAFSYSHAFIDPVPGIVWTRSATELLRYIASRILPSDEQRAQLTLLAHTEPWASEPGWYGASQTRRILRWVTSRPTRVETMQPVRAALEHR